jgi:hypothetical protein
MNKIDTMVGRFSATLRRSLFKEHFGLTNEQAMDPLDEDVF